MLNKRYTRLHEAVWEEAAEVGASAPEIADRIIPKLYPRTAAEARQEDADLMFRTGVVNKVSEILKKSKGPCGQIDFKEIDEEFRRVLKRLKLNSNAYYVESVGQYVEVQGLIAEPDMLDEAEQHLRRKGEECIAEADKLAALKRALRRRRK